MKFHKCVCVYACVHACVVHTRTCVCATVHGSYDARHSHAHHTTPLRLAHQAPEQSWWNTVTHTLTHTHTLRGVPHTPLRHQHRLPGLCAARVRAGRPAWTSQWICGGLACQQTATQQRQQGRLPAMPATATAKTTAAARCLACACAMAGAAETLLHTARLRGASAHPLLHTATPWRHVCCCDKQGHACNAAQALPNKHARTRSDRLQRVHATGRVKRWKTASASVLKVHVACRGLGACSAPCRRTPVSRPQAHAHTPPRSTQLRQTCTPAAAAVSAAHTHPSAAVASGRRCRSSPPLAGRPPAHVYRRRLNRRRAPAARTPC
jgi:hypothetical protein